jgi:2-polyprenyl-3-methyl-5-hydroxy-6-metoxy-1,4-benzoquinol methylase
MFNPFLARLLESGLTHERDLEPYADGVRDAYNMPMVRCRLTGAIFIKDIAHATVEHYEGKSFGEASEGFWGGPIDKFDLDRRTELLKSYVPGKHWLDFGCGFGDLVSTVGPFSKSVAATELNEIQTAHVRKAGFDVRKDLAEFGRPFDVVSMFHVLEHLPDPVAMLASIRQHMKPGGVIVVEVPHAGDFLLQGLQNEAFKRFTLWSEHLVLHTRPTLRHLLAAAGFETQSITGVQRYPVSNHLFWAQQGKPGGHEKMAFLNTQPLLDAYADALSANDLTDTLVAIGRVPQHS